MKKLFLAATLLVLALLANAGPIQVSTFSQNSGSNTITATANGALTETDISIVDAVTTISQLFNNITPITADFSLTAHSIDLAQTAFGLVVQHFAGTFCITSGIGCSGINFLSGVYTDAAIGALGGPGMVVNVNNPPDFLSLTSDVIPAGDLGSPSTFNLGFSNLTPALAICGNTLCSFTASFAGVVSANEEQVPSPTPLALMGAGLIGLGFIRGKKGLSF